MVAKTSLATTLNAFHVSSPVGIIWDGGKIKPGRPLGHISML